MTNSVPPSGSIEISFPLTHFEVPNSARSSRLRVGNEHWFTPDQEVRQTGIRFSTPPAGI